MTEESIKGYAIANRLLFDALDGIIDPEKLANLYDQSQDDPKVGLAKLHHLALKNHVLTKEYREAIGEALDMVDAGETDTRLTMEEQSTYVLEWFRAVPAKTYSVSEAAKVLGCTRAHVHYLIKQGRLEAERDASKNTSTSPWKISGPALRAYAQSRPPKE